MDKSISGRSVCGGLGLQIRRPEAGKYNLELELAGTGDGEASGRKGGGGADKEEAGGGAGKREKALAMLGSERGRRRGTRGSD
jgi:hypothetical protein